MEPLLASRLGDFDPVQYRSTLLSEVRQAVRAEAQSVLANVRSGSLSQPHGSAEGETGREPFIESA
jgi:hypothetical protein